MSSVVVAVLAVMVSLTVCQASPFYPYNMNRGMGSLPMMLPRCPSSSKPCRIRAEMNGFMGNQVIENQACSCATGKACPSDWSAADYIITRQLRTDSSINMTLSMMFCDVIQPRRQCNQGEVALQVKGFSVVPTEVVFMQCACADRRPLVLDERYHGTDHRQYDSYVCSNFKMV